MSEAADWQELHFTARKPDVEPLEDWLFAHGALSLTLEDQADQPLQNRLADIRAFMLTMR